MSKAHLIDRISDHVQSSTVHFKDGSRPLNIRKTPDGEYEANWGKGTSKSNSMHAVINDYVESQDSSTFKNSNRDRTEVNEDVAGVGGGAVAGVGVGSDGEPGVSPKDQPGQESSYGFPGVVLATLRRKKVVF